MTFPHASIRNYRGAPALRINGRPVFPFLVMSTGDGVRELRALGYQGSHLYTVECPAWWTGIGRFDFTAFDAECSAILTRDPEAWLFPRVVVSAPDEWMDRHPDECVAYADPAAWKDGSWGGPRKPSWASILWRRDGAEALRHLVRHVRKTPLAARILGWHIGAGVFGEWHYPNPMHYPDVSPAFQSAFAAWLRKRYGNPPPPPRIPTPSERQAGRHGMFHDPVQDRWMLDHAEFFHTLGAEALDVFAAVIKRETAGRSLVVAFNGYLPDLGVSHEADHSAFARTLRSPHIDAFASPHTYRRRKPGEDASMRGFLGSVRVMGKLWIDENDDRTYRTAKTWQVNFTHVRTLEDSIEILWRGFAQALTHNAGLWFMDQGAMWDKDPRVHFYNEPGIVRELEQMGRVARDSMHRSRTRASEIAVVCDYAGAFHCADPGYGGNRVQNTLYAETLGEIARCGAPVDFYQVTELFQPGVPRYRLYILLDLFHMDADRYRRFLRLSRAGAHLLSFYAPAYLDDTGFRPDRLCTLAGTPLDIRLMADEPGGQVPAFVPPHLKGTLARHGNRWYCPRPPVPAPELRAAARAAGVHVYLDTPDIVLAGGGYIAVHAATDGEKALRLPHASYWQDVRTGAVSRGQTRMIRFEARAGQTRLFSVGARVSGP